MTQACQRVEQRCWPPSNLRFPHLRLGLIAVLIGWSLPSAVQAQNANEFLDSMLRSLIDGQTSTNRTPTRAPAAGTAT